MKRIEDELGLFQGIMKAIVNTFGEGCEVVLHDWTKGYESTIVAIEGNLTNRKVGDCGSNLGLEVMRGTVSNENRYNYITKTKDNRMLRSSTTYIKDDDGNTIGAFCINYDITFFKQCRDVMNALTLSDRDTEEYFANDVNELLDYLIADSLDRIGKPVASLSKEEKCEAIEYLDSKGAFLITRSGPKVCEYFDISKYTLYAYLSKIHAANQKENEKNN